MKDFIFFRQRFFSKKGLSGKRNMSRSQSSLHFAALKRATRSSRSQSSLHCALVQSPKTHSNLNYSSRLQSLLLIILLLISSTHALIANGQVPLDNSAGYDKSGFDFLKGVLSGVEGDMYYYEGSLWTNHALGGIKEMGANDFNACDSTEYSDNVKPLLNNYYCIKTREGSYAKIRVTSLTSNSITINWEHQRDGTNLFVGPEIELVSADGSINYAMIVIIIILIAVILLVIKFR